MQATLTQGLLVAFTALSAWDVHTTSDARKRGYGKESTPWLRWINFQSEDFVFWFLLALKTCMVGALWYTRVDTIEAAWLYAAVLAVYAYFVALGNTKLWYAYHFKK